MFSLGADKFLMIMAVSVFLLGVISLSAGILVLVFSTNGKDVHTITSQTVRLAQKGIAEDVSGLVGNASGLLDTLNQMVRTATGVGALLILVGFILFGAAYLLVTGLP